MPQVIGIARSEDLLVEQIDGEAVVYDLESKEVHCLKPLAAVVFANSDGKSTSDEIALIAERELGTMFTASDIEAAASQLEAIGLIETPFVVLEGGVSRRDIMRKTAFAGALAAFAPLITSIAAPSAAMAQSGRQAGCGCGSDPLGGAGTCKNGDNNNCISHHCCQPDTGAKECNICLCVDDSNNCAFVTGTTNCIVQPAPQDGC
jgi:hypothetical protein